MRQSMAAHEMVSENTAPRGDILSEIKFDILRSEYIDGIKSIEDEAFSVPWSREAFVRELDNPVAVYTVALFDSRVIAYGGMWHILEEGQITNIAVRSDVRGRGVGNVLLAKMLASAREKGMERVTLEVRISNAHARRLYEKHGFCCAGVRRGYYPDGEDAAICWAEL